MIYVDSNALVYLLHDAKPKSDFVVDILSSSDEVYTSLRTIKEASYILVRVYLSKHYGIDTILTFDEDFKRIPWLKVVP